MNYPFFKEEDFCEDIDFIRWVISPTEQSNQFWASFLEKYPYKMKEIERATEFVKIIHFQEFEPSQDDLLRLKQRIWEDIEVPVRKVKWWNNTSYRAAAAIALLLISVGAFWWYRQPVTYKTPYGQIKKIELADGSVVTLNANTALKVANNIKNTQVREVWIEGEAFFDIAKLNGAKFIVHTPEATVEVLGTEFNVTARRKLTQVVLHEGKVKLSGPNLQDVVMKPGDMAKITEKAKAIQLKIVEPEQFDAWKKSLVILNDKSVAEIAQLLEDTYGITIQFENPLLLNKKLTGQLSLKSVDEFVENLATILDAQAEKTEKGYIFK